MYHCLMRLGLGSVFCSQRCGAARWLFLLGGGGRWPINAVSEYMYSTENSSLGDGVEIVLPINHSLCN